MNWLPLLLLTLLALLFPLFIVLRKPVETAGAAATGADTNVALYRERIAEIDSMLASGELGQEQAATRKTEQQRLLLRDTEAVNSQVSGTVAGAGGRLVLLLLVLIIPLAAFWLYQALGASSDLEIQTLAQQRSDAKASPAQEQRLRYQLLDRIEARLLAEPDEPGYRVMLARLYLQSGEMAKARQNYEHAARLLPGSPEVQAEYARATYLSNNGRFTPEVDRALQKALAADGGSAVALELRGLKALSTGDYAAAIADWRLALQRLPPQSARAATLNNGIQRARLALGEKLPGIEVDLALAPGLEAAPDQTVYLFARQWRGPPVPVAVARLKVADLPVRVKLDDTMAMPGGRLLSETAAIQLVARVSSTGAVTPSAGDLQGVSGSISMLEGTPNRHLVLEINTRL